MQSDFELAFQQYMEAESRSVSQAEYEGVLRFGLSSRKRGREFIQDFHQLTGVELSGKRVLDIGMAYGGFVIEAAKAGANAAGIEIMDYLYDLAVENARGEPNFPTLIHGDFLDQSARVKLGEDPFDVVILNDVFEHIHDLEHLCRCIQEVTAPGGIIYFAVPNGESWPMVEREGHRQVFALSLLEPAAWPAALNFPTLKYLNVHYRPLQTYLNHWASCGFAYAAVHYNDAKVKGVVERVIGKHSDLLDRIADEPFENAEVNKMALQKMRILAQKARRDSLILDPIDFYIRYELNFWRGIFSKDPMTGRQELPMRIYGDNHRVSHPAPLR